MNSTLQNEVNQLTAAEKLELAQWLMESARGELLEMPMLPELTPENLLAAIDRGLAEPRSGYTINELFQSLETRRA